MLSLVVAERPFRRETRFMRRAMGLRRALPSAALLLSVAGCPAMFGIDEPLLDPCAKGGCTESDSGSPGKSPDSATTKDAPIGAEATPGDATAEDVAATDGAPEDESTTKDGSEEDDRTDGAHAGVRCGTGGAGTAWCNYPAPVCCQTLDDAGVPAYGCVPSLGFCAGTPIQCASARDCAGGELCCRYNSGIKCEPSCANTNRVCDPSVAGSCPPGRACSVSLESAGLPPPYLECSP